MKAYIVVATHKTPIHASLNTGYSLGQQLKALHVS